MLAITPSTPGTLQTVTGIFTPASGTSVATFVRPWTLCLEVFFETPGSSAMIQFQDSSDGFVNDIMAGPAFTVAGGIGNPNSSAIQNQLYPNIVRFSVKQQDFPDLRIGGAAIELRACVTRFSGGGTLSFRSWLE